METTDLNVSSPVAVPAASSSAEVTRLSQISKAQWRSGLAAWLGWTFDGLDMHLYTLVAAPFVAQLLGATSTTDPAVGHYSSHIQVGFPARLGPGGARFCSPSD